MQTAIDAWRLELSHRKAERVLPVTGGWAFLNDTYRHSHDHNKILLSSASDGVQAVAEADHVLGGAGLSFRLVEAQTQAIAAVVRPALSAAGYECDNELVMRWDAARAPTSSGQRGVVEIDVSERCSAATEDWRQELPNEGEAVWGQLGERARTVADFATFFAVRAADGSVASRADLYLHDGIGHIEDVMTRVDQRGQGFASTIVLTAARRAVESAASVVFLVASADDWPQQLYRRLGFDTVGASASFTRT
ncbi:MAG: GNAT family N-acetyltransferase [Mycobacteriales bacterium]